MSKKINSHNNIILGKRYDEKDDFFFIAKIKHTPENKKIILPEIHRHPYFEVIVVTNGENVAEIDFKQYRFRRGDIILFSPQQIHNPISASEDFEAYILRFYPSIFDNAEFFNKISIFDYDYIELDKDHLPRVNMILEELEKEFSENQVFKKYAIGNMLKCFLILAQRALPNVITQKSSDNIFSKFNYFIVENEFKNKKASDYAKQLKISSRTLNDIVKKNADMTTTDYINSKIIYEAKRLLLFSDLSIKEIAYKLDFIDIGYFSRFFKKKVGESPLNFRENNK